MTELTVSDIEKLLGRKVKIVSEEPIVDVPKRGKHFVAMNLGSERQVGKTSTLVDISIRACNSGNTVMFLSNTMMQSDWVRRMLYCPDKSKCPIFCTYGNFVRQICGLTIKDKLIICADDATLEQIRSIFHTLERQPQTFWKDVLIYMSEL